MILIKYPKVDKTNVISFIQRKNKELTNLDWAKWAGWFDTDGGFYKGKAYYGKDNKISDVRKCSLYLKDRSPVELFSKTFESSLRYTESIKKPPKRTIEKYPRYKNIIYTAKEYKSEIFFKDKTIWFAENVYPYLLKKEKKDFAVSLIGYTPETKNFTDWTKQEIINYLATAFEGDGHFNTQELKNGKGIQLGIASSDPEYLSLIKYLLEVKLNIKETNFYEKDSYESESGEKTMYELNMYLNSNNENEISDLLKEFIKDDVMTLDRKKQKILDFFNYD